MVYSKLKICNKFKKYLPIKILYNFSSKIFLDKNEIIKYKNLIENLSYKESEVFENCEESYKFLLTKCLYLQYDKMS